MRSTGGSAAPSSLVMSPTWIMPGKRCFVTSMGKASISLAHTGVIPLRTAARGKPPIPSKRPPIVSIFLLLSLFRCRLHNGAGSIDGSLGGIDGAHDIPLFARKCQLDPPNQG